MGFHFAEAAGAVAITLVGAWGNFVALGAVAHLLLAPGFGVGDDLGVLLAVCAVTERARGNHRRRRVLKRAMEASPSPTPPAKPKTSLRRLRSVESSV